MYILSKGTERDDRMAAVRAVKGHRFAVIRYHCLDISRFKDDSVVGTHFLVAADARDVDLDDHFDERREVFFTLLLTLLSRIKSREIE